MRVLKQKYWHELFEAGVALKALNGVWETAGGIIFLTVGPAWLYSLFAPFAFIGRHLHHPSPGTQLFVGIYLLAHGLMNFFLSYNLFRNRLWSYPLSIAFVCLFMLYQIYRIAHTHSPFLLALTIFDAFFIILTWHEYQYQRRRSGRLPDQGAGAN